MKMPEYDRFSYDGKNVELIDALDQQQNNLLEYYNRNKLYCPECEKARLKFTCRTNARRAYLSTIPSSPNYTNTHDDNCSHSFEPASRRQTNKYYDNLTEEQIQDKLDAAINRYLRRNESSEEDKHHKHTTTDPAIVTILSRDCQVQKRLPTKSIYTIYNVTDEELDIPILFYGDVKLRIKQNESKYENGRYYYYLILISSRTGKPIKPLYRAGNRDEVREDILYHIVFIGFFSKTDSGDYRLKLYNQKAIKFIEV